MYPGVRIFTAAVGVFFILTIFGDPAAAQDPPTLLLDSERSLSEYRFESWTEADGLPTNTIDAIVQGDEGYLWFGLEIGLVRFDGRSFKVFKHADIEALKVNQISTLTKDPRGGFWIGTDGGGLTHYSKGRFKPVAQEGSLANAIIQTVYHTDSSTVWVGTPNGVSRLSNGRLTNYTAADGLPSESVLSVTEDLEETVWIGTDAGLWRWKRGRLLPPPKALKPLQGQTIKALLTTQAGELWIGTSTEGVCRYKNKNLKCFSKEDGLSSIHIVSLYEDRSQTLWVGTATAGLNRFEGKGFSALPLQEDVSHQEVRDIYQDQEHNLWFGLDGGGIGRLRNTKFTELTKQKGLSGNNILAITEDHTGAMWFGTDGSGLTRMKDGEFTYFNTSDGLPSNQVQAFEVDHRGRLWFGTWAGGVCHFNNSLTSVTCYSTEDGLAGNNVFSIFEDSNHVIWIGTHGGLSRIQNGHITSYTPKNGLPNKFILDIQEHTKGELWLSTYGGGIIQMKDEKFTTFTAEGTLSSDIVLTFHKDAEDNLWAGTLGGGICRYAEKSFNCVTVDQGLPSNDILQIVEEDNHLWIGTLNGIFRVAKESLHQVISGDQLTVQTDQYGSDDGLPSNEMNGGTHPAAWRSSDGRLWFSTVAGVGIVNPEKIPTNRIPPPVVLKQVLVEDQKVPVKKELTLPPGSRKVEFHFSGLSYTVPEHVNYRYKLRGYDEQWVEAGSRQEAYYTNLSPGTYTFHVTAANNDGFWNPQGASITFTIEPFFYQTLWFYLVCAGAITLMGFGAYRFRVKHLRAREEELSRLVDEQTQELREREQDLEQLNKDLESEVDRQLEIILAERERNERKRIQLEERKRYEKQLIKAKEAAEESARLKSTILMNMSHEIRTPLTSILGFAEVLEEEIDDSLLQFAQLIHNSGKRLLDTLNSVLDMSQLEANSMTIEASKVDVIKELEETLEMMTSQAESKGLYLNLETTDTDQPLWAFIDRSFLHRIINNLVGNALKFTETGGITVEVATDGDQVILEVEDTGIGIDEEFLPHLFDAFKQESTGLRRSHEGTGLGMAITKRLVELMDGSIEVESQQDVGTTFSVTFPRRVAQPAEQ